MKICVTEAIDPVTRKRIVGIFEWKGKSWRTAQLVRLIKELPATLTNKERTAEYYRMKEELNAK